MTSQAILKAINKVQSVLAMEPEIEEIPQSVHALVEQRALARSAKDWKSSDSLRDQIQALGWTVKDGKDGQKLTRT